MTSKAQRILRLERREQKKWPPLIISGTLTAGEAAEIQRNWIRAHGAPGPLIIRRRTEETTREVLG